VAVRPEGWALAGGGFARAGHLDPPDARDRASWQHGGGFSLDVRLPIATERYSLTVQ
jgi:hypothetical protein